MPLTASINEPQTYSFEGMTPNSINEPTIFPPPPSPLPVITSIAPSTCAIGAADITLSVTGTGFVATSAIFFAGVKKSTTLGGDGKLTTRIKPVNWTNPATVQCQIRNGGQGSNLKDFVFTATVAADEE